MLDGGSCEVGASHDSCSSTVYSGGEVEIPGYNPADVEADTDTYSEGATIECKECDADTLVSIMSQQTDVTFMVDGETKGWTFYVRNVKRHDDRDYDSDGQPEE